MATVTKGDEVKVEMEKGQEMKRTLGLVGGSSIIIGTIIGKLVEVILL